MTVADSSPLPDDRAIPALVEMARRGVEPVLADLGIETAPGETRVLKYHEGSRITFVTGAGASRVAVKCFAGSAAPLIELSQWFENVGLTSGDHPMAAPVRVADEDRRVIVSAWVEGRPATDLVVARREADAGALAASWLTATEAVLRTAAFGPAGDRIATMRNSDRYARTLARRDRPWVPPPRTFETRWRASPTGLSPSASATVATTSRTCSRSTNDLW